MAYMDASAASEGVEAAGGAIGAGAAADGGVGSAASRRHGGRGRIMRLTTLGAVALLAVVLAACGGGGAVSYKDGTYTGESSVFEDSEDGNGNGYGVATVTIEDGAITACEFLTYEPDGTLKDEDYGKAGGAIANQDYYNKAQRAVAACAEYADKLVAVGNLDGVDVISGATISYGEFQEAVQAALDQAAE